MKHVTKFQKSIFVSLAVLGFVGGMQMSDIINSGDGSAIRAPWPTKNQRKVVSL